MFGFRSRIEHAKTAISLDQLKFPPNEITFKISSSFNVISQVEFDPSPFIINM